MSTVGISSLTENAKSYLTRSISKPKMFITFKGGVNKTFEAQFGIQKDEDNVVVYDVKDIKLVDLASIDKMSREYFKGSRFITTFPKKATDSVDEEMTKYFFELLKIPGFALFPPFVDLIHYDLKLFASIP